MKANKNAEKLNDNAKTAQELMKEGEAIMRRINKEQNKLNELILLFHIYYMKHFSIINS